MFKSVLISMITSVLVIVFALVGIDTLVNNQRENNDELNRISYESNEGESLEFIDEESNAIVPTNSVVGIAVKQNSGNRLALDFDNNYSVGSGCILDSRGYIVTNYHVIGNVRDDIMVTLYGGDVVKGRTVWANSSLDLAVIKVDVAGLPSATMGDSDSLKIGERAIAIGNPLGFEFQGTLTSGVVSGLNRSIEVEGNYMEDLIQTDASINSGNSGGPLMNGNGEVIGINTIKVASAEGIGFAIPINQIKPVIEKIVATGTFNEPYFGVLGYDKAMTSSFASNIMIDSGIYVYSVDYGSPAYDAGIKKGDVILEVEGINVDTLCKLRTILFSKNIGEKMRVKVLSIKEVKEVLVTIEGKK